MQALPQDDRERAFYSWELWARDNQLPPPGDWRFWVLLAGRGFGKSRVACEWACQQARELPGSRGALVARTAADVRDVMIEGESGVLAVSPPWFRPMYEPTKRRLTWPNGSIATTYSGEEPNTLRGPQHHWAVCDELAFWRRPEAWDMLLFGLRLGDNPRCVIATTPRPTPCLKDLIKHPAATITRGTTYENRGNLAPQFFADIIRKYEGTRLGRQELNAEILEDNPGALWRRASIEAARVVQAPPLTRIVVAIDPAATSDEGAADTGIIVAGIAKVAGHIHGYILDDCTCHGTPAQWSKRAVEAFFRWKADRIVGEANNGGEMVEHTLRTVRDEQDRAIGRTLPYRSVHASRGKQIRAEPISALYEQGLVHHIGAFPELEDQMCQWVPGETSPDRLDAMVWAMTELTQSATGNIPIAGAGRVRPT